MEQTTHTRPTHLLTTWRDGSVYEPTGESSGSGIVAIPVSVSHSYDASTDRDTYEVTRLGAAVVLPDNDDVVTY